MESEKLSWLSEKLKERSLGRVVQGMGKESGQHHRINQDLQGELRLANRPGTDYSRP